MIMRDSTRAGLIPLDTPVVAGYADGLWAWTAADWGLFPHAVKLSICAHPASAGDILDVEMGDAVPDDVPGWIDRFNRPGRRHPTIYCSRSAITAVRIAAGQRPFDWWAATLDGTTSVPGAVAVQYADLGGYDESVILDPTWVGVPVTPTAPEFPPPFGEVMVMSLDAARVVFWSLRLLLLGPSTLSESNAQAAVDAYASRVAAGENPEKVLSDFYADCQRDGRLLAPYRAAGGA